MVESLFKKLKGLRATQILFGYDNNPLNKGEQLIRHYIKKIYFVRRIVFLVFIDDDAILFISRERSILGSNVICNQIVHPELNMYVSSII